MNVFKKHRLLAGKTITQVASDIGANTTSVSAWEKGERCPHPSRLKALANSYNCSVEELICAYESED